MHVVRSGAGREVSLAFDSERAGDPSCEKNSCLHSLPCSPNPLSKYLLADILPCPLLGSESTTVDKTGRISSPMGSHFHVELEKNGSKCKNY